MKVLVTGANGFLGRYVIQKIRERSAEVEIRCLVRAGSDLNGLDDNDIEVVRGSLNDSSIYTSLLGGVDALIHLAASMGGSPMGMFIETVVSTEQLMKHVQQSSVKKVIFCSSFSVYGSASLPANSIFDEECPIETYPYQRDPYAWCKYYQEKVVVDACKNKTLITLRPGVIYGENKGLLSPRIGLQLPGTSVFLQIGSRAHIPLTQVENCADAFALALLDTSTESGVFNIVDDDCPTQKTYLQMYQERFGKIPRRIYLPYTVFLCGSYFVEWLNTLSKGNFPNIFTPYKTRSMYRVFNYSNSKIKKRFGWIPTVSLQQGLKKAKID